MVAKGVEQREEMEEIFGDIESKLKTEMEQVVVEMEAWVSHRPVVFKQGLK